MTVGVGPADLPHDLNQLTLFQFDLPQRLFNWPKSGPHPGLSSILRDPPDAFFDDFQGGFGDQAEALAGRPDRAPAARIMSMYFDRVALLQILRRIMRFTGSAVNRRVVEERRSGNETEDDRADHSLLPLVLVGMDDAGLGEPARESHSGW